MSNDNKKGELITFKKYVINKFYGNDTPKGDFAEDIKSDHSFPKWVTIDTPNGYYSIKKYLLWNNACQECLDAFLHCWKSYARSMGFYPSLRKNKIPKFIKNYFRRNYYKEHPRE